MNEKELFDYDVEVAENGEFCEGEWSKVQAGSPDDAAENAVGAWDEDYKTLAEAEKSVLCRVRLQGTEDWTVFNVSGWISFYYNAEELT